MLCFMLSISKAYCVWCLYVKDLSCLVFVYLRSVKLTTKIFPFDFSKLQCSKTSRYLDDGMISCLPSQFLLPCVTSYGSIDKSFDVSFFHLYKSWLIFNMIINKIFITFDMKYESVKNNTNKPEIHFLTQRVWQCLSNCHIRTFQLHRAVDGLLWRSIRPRHTDPRVLYLLWTVVLCLVSQFYPSKNLIISHRVGKNPGFLWKTHPNGFFVVLCSYM